MHVRSDVTKWRRAFLLWGKPEEKLCKNGGNLTSQNDHGFCALRLFRQEKFTFIAFNFSSELFL